jgi:hypothetical protein
LGAKPPVAKKIPNEVMKTTGCSFSVAQAVQGGGIGSHLG